MEIYHIHPFDYISSKKYCSAKSLQKHGGQKIWPAKKMNAHRAQVRLHDLAHHLKFSPRQFYFPATENYRFALAASPTTVLVTDFLMNEAWVVPYGRIVKIYSGTGRQAIPVVNPGPGSESDSRLGSGDMSRTGTAPDKDTAQTRGTAPDKDKAQGTDKVQVTGELQQEEGVSGHLQFLFPVQAPHSLDVIWGNFPEHLERISNGGMAAWEWDVPG